MNAVLTIAIGEDYGNLAKLTHPLISKYAKRIGAEFIVIDRKKISLEWPHYEKFQIYDLLGKYNRIAYIDTDIVVRDDCPNLFDVVPENKIGMFNEGAVTDRAGALALACKDHGIKMRDWTDRYYNTGVMVVSRVHREIFKKPEKEIFNFFEQSYVNAVLMLNSARMLDLPYSFNRMKCMDELVGEHRLMSHMIHYAGVLENRDKIIQSDISRLEKQEYKTMRKRVLIEIGTEKLGDTVCVEPTVRYILDHPNDATFAIVSNHPAVFSHFSDRALVSDFVNYNPPYDTPVLKIKTCMDEKSPTRKFFNSDQMHITDYTSLLCLKRVLTAQEKIITLKISQRGLSQALEVIGSGDFILVHPGQSWRSKTFPSGYWEKIISKLTDCDQKVVIIGKQGNTTGTVQLSVPQKAIDARNLLDTDGLIAAIGMAKAIVTNDSGPLHIAGAFPDTRIILIPSCKHPEMVLPWRAGKDGYISQYHNAYAPYKKLTSDGKPFDAIPNLADYQIDEDSLPSTDNIAALATK